jgi:DNA-binding LytR/AlgR family response regulator
MNCIIIDDESHCIKTLTNLLENNFKEVKVMATCHEATRAFDMIQQYKPDFIFLDIEMPLLNDYSFFRIHHSSLINLKQVKKYICGEGGEVIMSNNKALQVSRTKKADFLNVFLRF